MYNTFELQSSDLFCLIKCENRKNNKCTDADASAAPFTRKKRKVFV